MERVDRQVALLDVGVDGGLRPVGERVRLPELVALVPAELLRVRPGGGLLAPHAGDPAVEAGECVAERADLADRAAEGRVRRPQRVAVDRGLAPERRALVHLDLDPVALLHLPPDVVGLGEEHVGVEREDARVGLDREQHVEQHRLFPLEGAGERELRVEVLDHHTEHLGRRERLRIGVADERPDVRLHRWRRYQLMRTDYSLHKSISQVGKVATPCRSMRAVTSAPTRNGHAPIPTVARVDELPGGLLRVTMPLPTRPGHVHCYLLAGRRRLHARRHRASGCPTRQSGGRPSSRGSTGRSSRSSSRTSTPTTSGRRRTFAS